MTRNKFIKIAKKEIVKHANQSLKLNLTEDNVEQMAYTADKKDGKVVHMQFVAVFNNTHEYMATAQTGNGKDIFVSIYRRHLNVVALADTIEKEYA